MAVQTSKDMAVADKSAAAKSQGKQTKQSGKQGQQPKQPKLRDRFFLPSAPEGKANTAFVYQGETYQVELTDGVYEIPQRWSESDKRRWRTMLKSAGFEDVSEWSGEKKGRQRRRDRSFEIVYRHPDHTPDAPINGKVGMTLGDTNMQLDLAKDGTVKVRDKAIQDALHRLGWPEVHREDITDEKTHSGGSKTAQ